MIDVIVEIRGVPSEARNEYDDEAYTEASDKLINGLTGMLDDMVASGASLANIQSDMASAVENSDLASA